MSVSNIYERGMFNEIFVHNYVTMQIEKRGRLFFTISL